MVHGHKPGKRDGTGFQWYPALAVGVFVAMLQLLPLPAAADFNNFPCKMKITFSGYNKPETLTNFPALITLNENIPHFRYSHFASTSGGDLRFVNSNETVELNYEIEEWNTNGNSYVWVQVPKISDTNTYIWALYGNPSATTPPAYTTDGSTWTNGYRGVWHFGRLSGVENLKDSTTNHYDGTDQGLGEGTISTPARISFGQNFIASSNNSIYAGQSKYFLPLANSPVTVSFWLKPRVVSSSSIFNRVLTIHDGTPGTVLLLACGSFDRFQLYHDGATVTGATLNSTSSINAANWYHVAATLDGTMARLYLNGVLDTSETGDLNVGSTYALRLGSYEGSMNFYDGILDEVRISSVPRSANWIWASCLNQTPNSAFASYFPLISDANGATNVGSNAADLTGYLGHADEVQTYAWVYYGETDQGTNKSAWFDKRYFGQVSAGLLSTNVSGLTSDRTYYYRFYVSNSVRQAWTPATPFITAPVSIQATDNYSSEMGPNTGMFTLFRPAGLTNAALEVRYRIDGSASNGVDYQQIPQSIIIPAGQTNAVIMVIPVQDSLTELSESVTLTLAGNGIPGSPSSAGISIQDPVAALFNWNYRMKITFTGYDRPETLTNFPVLVVLNTNLTDFSYGLFASPADGGDLMFINSSGTKMLNHEIEEWNTNGNSYVWVQVPELIDSNTYIEACIQNKNVSGVPAFTTNGATWSRGYAGVWHLVEQVADETSGGIHRDSTANGNYGVQYNNGPVTGEISYAQNFDGSDYINCGSDPSLNNLTSLTVEAWVNVTNAGGWFTPIVAKYGFSGSKESWGLGWINTRVLGFYIRDTNNTAVQVYAQTGWGLDGSWHHMAATWHGSEAILYGDGFPIAVSNNVIGPTTNSQPVTIARHISYSTGSYDDIRISDHARSSNWIWACWLNQASNLVFSTYDAPRKIPARGTVITAR
jgi:hypothetical protein